MAGAEANKIPATKLAKAAAATDETSAAGLGSVKADDPSMRAQLTGAGEAHAAGYLLASVVPANEETVAPERVVVDDDESSVACVVVAGLTHVNGVVAGLASV